MTLKDYEEQLIRNIQRENLYKLMKEANMGMTGFDHYHDQMQTGISPVMATLQVKDREIRVPNYAANREIGEFHEGDEVYYCPYHCDTLYHKDVEIGFVVRQDSNYVFVKFPSWMNPFRQVTPKEGWNVKACYPSALVMKIPVENRSEEIEETRPIKRRALDL